MGAGAVWLLEMGQRRPVGGLSICEKATKEMLEE